MKSVTKIDLKGKLAALYEITNDAGDFISLMQTAFIYNTPKPLQGFKAKADECEKETLHLSTIIKEAASDDESMEPYAFVPEHLMEIWRNLGKLSGLINRKISEDILFSDKGVNETIYLLQRLVEVLRPTADMILARNIFLSKYIQESQASIEKMAVEYATLHENRLITGECLPAASSIYVGILEAIKSIAWHTKEIAIILGK